MSSSDSDSDSDISLDYVRYAIQKVVAQHRVVWYAGKEYRCVARGCEWSHKSKMVAAIVDARWAHAKHVSELLVMRLAEIEDEM